MELDQTWETNWSNDTIWDVLFFGFVAIQVLFWRPNASIFTNFLNLKNGQNLNSIVNISMTKQNQKKGDDDDDDDYMNGHQDFELLPTIDVDSSSLNEKLNMDEKGNSLNSNPSSSNGNMETTHDVRPPTPKAMVVSGGGNEDLEKRKTAPKSSMTGFSLEEDV